MHAAERIYDVTQKCFPITIHMNSYPCSAQAGFVACVFMLHNFIRNAILFLKNEFYDDSAKEADDPCM